MTPRPARQKRSYMRLALYGLVLLTFIIAFLYAYELTGGLIDALLDGFGDVLGQF